MKTIRFLTTHLMLLQTLVVAPAGFAAVPGGAMQHQGGSMSQTPQNSACIHGSGSTESAPGDMLQPVKALETPSQASTAPCPMGAMACCQSVAEQVAADGLLPGLVSVGSVDFREDNLESLDQSPAFRPPALNPHQS